jgi:23S rRNA (guanosine2251-2'-O)-methyltransferase
MTTGEFQAWKCPGCGLRFSSQVDGPGGEACPKCGETLEEAGTRYSSQRIGRVNRGSLPAREVLLDNLRSAWNVGSIFRTAEGAGIRHIYLCGITPTPENVKVAKTALGSELRVCWSYHPDSLALVDGLRSEGRWVWCLEGGPLARPISQAGPVPRDTRLVWVFGSEVGGVDPDVIAACDGCWYIPMAGRKESLNIAVAAGIALFQLT